VHVPHRRAQAGQGRQGPQALRRRRHEAVPRQGHWFLLHSGACVRDYEISERMCVQCVHVCMCVSFFVCFVGTLSISDDTYSHIYIHTPKTQNTTQHSATNGCRLRSNSSARGYCLVSPVEPVVPVLVEHGIMITAKEISFNSEKEEGQGEDEDLNAVGVKRCLPEVAIDGRAQEEQLHAQGLFMFG